MPWYLWANSPEEGYLSTPRVERMPEGVTAWYSWANSPEEGYLSTPRVERMSEGVTAWLCCL
jgi:hypothetical protein